MAMNLKGQLGVKSGPLAPTSSKLTTQMLVISHMENHYKKISTAKPAIDSGRPKSMTSSQKMRDRRSRNVIEKYGSRPASRLTYRPDSAEEDIYDEGQWEEPEDEEERQVRDIMRTTLRVPLKARHDIGSTDATDGSKSDAPKFGTTTMRPNSAMMANMTQAMQGLSQMGRTRPMSARSTTSLASNLSQTSRATNSRKVTYDGDVLDKHAHNFTEPTKPFTPRTLKSNRESSLKRYKYYTPPPPKKGQGGGNQANGDTAVKEVPQAKPRGMSGSKGGGGRDLGATETLTETMLMDMSLQSHEPRQRSATGSGGVPRLDISMDKDHLSWVQEQATRAHIRASNGTSSHPEEMVAHHDGGDMLEQTGEEHGKTDTLRFTRTLTSAKYYGGKPPSSRRLGQAEEEQKYVAFAHEVTQDIVSRGISSDRVLQRVFEKHIERKKEELDERRLRAIITDIRRDLGVRNVAPLDMTSKSVHYDEDMDQTESFHGQATADSAALDYLTTNNTTLSGTNNTYNFDRTTDVFSTIHTQPDNEAGGLTDTQVLQQYQMDLTVKDNTEDQNSVSNEMDDQTSNADNSSVAMGSTMVNGNGIESSPAGSEQASEAAAVTKFQPAAKPRQLTRQDASTAGQDNTSRQASVTDTDAKTEEEEEEDVEEEYEDDYDADEDDGTQKASDDDF